jgi:hypothetical protein
VLRTILCVGLLGSATTIFLGPNTATSVIATIVFVACLIAGGFLSLHRASRRIDDMLAEELSPAKDNTEPEADSWRKTA